MSSKKQQAHILLLNNLLVLKQRPEWGVRWFFVEQMKLSEYSGKRIRKLLYMGNKTHPAFSPNVMVGSSSPKAGVTTGQ
jgi:hypothetical protein